MGLLGSNVVQVALQQGGQVTATAFRHRPQGDVPYDLVQLDLRDRDRVLGSVRDARPDAVIHTAILNDLPRLYRERALGWQSYVEATRHLVDAANAVEAKLVFVSTDWVFDGTQAPAAEDAPPNPINLYGVLKLVGETLVHERAQQGAVARVAGVFGVHWARPDKGATQNAGFGDLATAVADALEQEQPFELWEGEGLNHRANPTLASDAAEGLLRLAQSDHTGVFHCCGRESVSRRQLALATAEAFGGDPALIRSSTPLDPTGVPVPADTGLSAQHSAARLGTPPPTLPEALARFRRQRRQGRLH